MTPNVIQIQPVEPPRPSTESISSDVVAAFVTALISGLFLMLGTNALHGYIPAVPPLGYWASVAIMLALGGIGGSLFKTSWKWARR